MNFGSLFFSPHLTASFYISRSLPLLLSGASLLLLSLSLWAWWSNVRSLDGLQGKMSLRQESQNWKAQLALKQLRTAGLQMGIAIVFFSLGYLLGFNHRLSQALDQVTNKVEVLNAVVEKQNGLTLIFHYLDDPAEAQHTQIFCAEPANRVPHFKPRQIIRSMELVRHEDCEVAQTITLRRINGVAILARGY